MGLSRLKRMAVIEIEQAPLRAPPKTRKVKRGEPPDALLGLFRHDKVLKSLFRIRYV